DKPAEPVTQDVTYVAQWQTSTRFYTVDWQMPSGETVRQGRETYHATPVVPTVPSMYYEGEGCVRYDFVGWDKQVAPVTEDVIYTAQYRQTVLAEAENEELTLTSALGEYTLTGSGARAAVGGLFDVAKKEKKRVALSFPELSASLDVEAVKSLEQAGVAYTAVLRDTSGGVGVGFYSAEGKAVRASAGLMHISFAYEPMEGATVCSLACDMAGNEFMSSCTPENGTLTLSAAANCTYRAAYQFPLTVQSEGGTVFANGEQYFIGEMPRLTSYPNSQHILSQISLTNNLTGESVILDSLSDFVMPAYPATLSVTFVPQTYRVVFVLNGEIISEAEYLLGDTVVVPQIETAFVEDGYRYTFIGWSSPIGAVTGDATYEAKFFSTPIEEVPENLTGEGQATQAAIKELSLLGVAGVAVLAVLIVLPIVGARIIIKKKKRKKIVDDDQA
ncbi:MAG: hypothetical protein J6U87_01330, partial [Clostridia bacterium]|nr:hypothetical protein [Clostridia bacterium]